LDVRDFKISDEIFFLCLLHNTGVTNLDRSLTLEEAANWSSMESDKARGNLDKLIEENYVQKVFIEGVEKYHLTANGIRKVLSIYS
jgi:hypothetical protein